MTTDVDMAETRGETSKAGLRRMRRLAAESRASSQCCRMAFHPKSELMIYSAPGRTSGLLVSPILHSAPPRVLPLPAVLPPGRDVAISPDGLWITVYHPAVGNAPGMDTDSGGTLAIYPSSILSPHSTSGTVTPNSSLSLPSAPLALQYLFPPEPQSPTRLRSAGPTRPPSYDPTTGPALLVLTSTSILLIHPHQVPGPVPIGLSANQGIDVSAIPMEWQMNVTRCPLHAKWHARIGDGLIPPINTGYAVCNGWMGKTQGDKAVWIATERNGDVRVIRALAGIDSRGMWYLQVTPMPKSPLKSPPRDPVSDVHVKSVVFVPLTDTLRSKAFPHDSKPASSEGIAAVVCTRETSDNATVSRLESFGFERREVEIATAFGEISGQSDGPKMYDWFALPRPMSSTASPDETAIMALTALPNHPNPNIAAALLSTPKGVVLVHLDMAAGSPEQDVKDEDGWAARIGTSVSMGDWDVDVQLIPSVSASKGNLGLYGVQHEDGVTLVVAPESKGDEGKVSLAEKAATSIVSAMRNGENWSDVLRAAISAVSQAEKTGLIDNILQGAWSRLEQEPNLDDLREVLKLQIVSLSTEVAKREVASELLKMHDASQLFTNCAKVVDDKLSFELGSVWPLLDVTEWVYTTLAAAMREFIVERGKLEWSEGRRDSTDCVRVVYLLVPRLRRLVIKTLRQIKAFTGFVLALNRPIATNSGIMGAGERDVRVTIMAKERVRGLEMTHGLGLELWGKALEALDGQAGAEEESTEQTKALLSLDPNLQPVKAALESIPNPSTLFLAEPETQVFDCITFVRLTTPRAACGRCHARTGVNLASGGFGASSRGLGAIGQAGEDPWMRWVVDRKGGCSCGGAWSRA